MAGAEGQLAGVQLVNIGAGNVGADVIEQHLPRGIVIHEARGIDAADPAPGGQGDVPQPARRMGRTHGLRGDGCIGQGRHLHGQCAVVEGHVAAVDPATVAGPADQDCGLARAIEEQVTRQRRMAAQVQRGDVAIFRRDDAGYFGGDPGNAQPFGGMAGKQRRELARVQMITVIQRPRVIGHRPLARGQIAGAGGGLRGHRGGERRVRRSGLPRGQQRAHIALRRGGEGVEIAVTGRAIDPAVKPRPLLEAGVAFAQEFAFGDADAGQRFAHRRPGAFADADGRNIRRFDQRDRQVRSARGQQCCRQPSGGAPSDDYHALN